MRALLITVYCSNRANKAATFLQIPFVVIAGVAGWGVFFKSLHWRPIAA